MKAENINIKKLEQFCKILLKLGITKNMSSTTTVKKIMSVREFEKLRQDYSLGKLKSEHLPRFRPIQEKVWNDDKQEFEVLCNLVPLYEIAEHGMTEEEFYNQTLEAYYEVSNQRYATKIINLLSRFLGIGIEQATTIYKENECFKNVVKYMASNTKKLKTGFFTVETLEMDGKQALALSFANMKYRVQVAI
jgi:hypothetical protein